MAQGIEFAVGISILFICLSCLLRTGEWIAWCKQISEGGRPSAVGLGAWSFMFCALIVGLHPVWDGPGMIVTIVGVIGMAEAALYLLFPAALPRLWSPFIKSAVWMRMASVAGLVLGLIVLCGWAQQNGISP